MSELLPNGDELIDAIIELFDWSFEREEKIEFTHILIIKSGFVFTASLRDVNNRMFE